MSFKYTAAALAASSLLVSAAPAPRPAEQHQEPANVARPFWDPNYYGYNYGISPYTTFQANLQPQSQDYWGPAGFDGEAWNNDHRLNPALGSAYRRSQDNEASKPQFPGYGPPFGDYSDDDDDINIIVLNSPLGFIGDLLGDLLGFGQPAALPRPPRPQGFPKGIPGPYPGAPYPGGPRPRPLPKGLPRPRPFPKGVNPGGPLVSNLPNGAGQASLGLIGGGFSLDPVNALPTPGPFAPGSPAGPFPKGWPTARPTPAPVAPGIIAPLPAGSQSLGIIGTSFSLDGTAPTPAAVIPAPIPVAAQPTPLVSALPSSAGTAPSGAASIGLLGGGFSLDGTSGAAATGAVPVPQPFPIAAQPVVQAAPSSGASLGALSGSFSLDGSSGSASGAVPVPQPSPIEAQPVVQAAPSAGASLGDVAGSFSLEGSSPSPATAAAVPSPAPASSALTQADSGIAGNAAAGLGGLSSSATIS